MARITGVIAAAILCVVLLVGPAAAWEFSMTADYNWNYYSEGQTGTEGFFGTYNLDNSPLGQGNQNFWGGVNRLPGLYSGSNAARQSQYMDFSPEIKLNQAVRIRGTYRVGSWLYSPQQGFIVNLNNSEYDSSSLVGSRVSMSPGFWNQLWLSAQTPWGILVMGKRPFTFGIGTFLNGEDNTTADALLLAVPYGPMTFGMGFWPARGLPDTEPGANPAKINLASDSSFLRSPEAAAFVTYNAGSLSLGAFYEYLRWSLGPESRSGTPGVFAPFGNLWAQSQFIPRETIAQWGVAFMKYNNCRFFLNAEVDLWYSKTTNQPNLTGTDWAGNPPYVTNIPGGGSVYRPKYTEMERYAIETGTMIGPSKLSLMGARIPGLDRRHGVLIDKQGNGVCLGPDNSAAGIIQLHPELSNTGFFNPYSYLMVFQYGGGLGVTNSNGDGVLVDANALGARLDYAVAANLNVWASAFYAERVSHGYGWGCLSPNVGQFANGTLLSPNSLFGAPEGSSVVFNQNGTYDPGNGAAAAPAIPDNSLGYEFGGGADWLLLQNLRFNARAAYWLPGKWFYHACVSRVNPGWNVPAAGNMWGTQPNRDISSVLGLRFQVAGEF